ncbi:hypothetical protein HPB48_020679 [Haemaphysalis longicornis]|uniref:Uncharacterized protein n=1 Tax=Haemaphysalis longicornis TaxID=44386 RepID=A0A9J6FTR9_HAELO|nr:hypothetical protein HPB48_020679 [Haemaphysalis longicornis]
MRFLRIEWAPLRLPLHRRLETLAALYYTFSFLAFGALSFLLLMYLLLCTRFYLLPALYFAWLFWDRDVCERGGRRSHWARCWTIWRLAVEDFAKLKKESLEGKLVNWGDEDPFLTEAFSSVGIPCVYSHEIEPVIWSQLQHPVRYLAS